jgi:hypothetical protein
VAEWAPSPAYATPSPNLFPTPIRNRRCEVWRELSWGRRQEALRALEGVRDGSSISAIGGGKRFESFILCSAVHFKIVQALTINCSCLVKFILIITSKDYISD